MAKTAASNTGRSDIHSIEDLVSGRYANRMKVKAMINSHIKRSPWLKTRKPLLHAMADVAFESGTSDSVRIRAMERIEDILEKAEDENRRQTTGNMEESIETSLRRLETAIRRSS